MRNVGFKWSLGSLHASYRRRRSRVKSINRSHAGTFFLTPLHYNKTMQPTPRWCIEQPTIEGIIISYLTCIIYKVSLNDTEQGRSLWNKKKDSTKCSQQSTSCLLKKVMIEQLFVNCWYKSLGKIRSLSESDRQLSLKERHCVNAFSHHQHRLEILLTYTNVATTDVKALRRIEYTSDQWTIYHLSREDW